MTLYGRSDIDDVTMPQPNGTTHRHVRTKKMQKEDGKPGPFLLECESCCAEMIKRDPGIMIRSTDPTVQFTTHWASNPTSVPKSEAEKAEEEEQQRAFMAGNLETYREFTEFQNSKRRKPINVGR